MTIFWKFYKNRQKSIKKSRKSPDLQEFFLKSRYFQKVLSRRNSENSAFFHFLKSVTCMLSFLSRSKILIFSIFKSQNKFWKMDMPKVCPIFKSAQSLSRSFFRKVLLEHNALILDFPKNICDDKFFQAFPRKKI